MANNKLRVYRINNYDEVLDVDKTDIDFPSHDQWMIKWKDASYETYEFYSKGAVDELLQGVGNHMMEVASTVERLSLRLELAEATLENMQTEKEMLLRGYGNVV